MTDVETIPGAAITNRLNVTDRLTTVAQTVPDLSAIICVRRRSADTRMLVRGKSGDLYDTISFAELDHQVNRIAAGIAAWGVPPGTRLALLVRPGIEFVALVFALLRAGMVIVLVDPGLGRRNLIRCLSETEPEGFVAISQAQAVRAIMRSRFPRARWNVTIGHRWFWGGKTLDELLPMGDAASKAKRAIKPSPLTHADDAAAIVFTSGSTGAPKGVLYTHQMFDTQVAEIQSRYEIEPRGVDLACFPLFALFNAAMGVTTVLPNMDFSRPACADPRKLLAAANDWQATQAFASPAVWRKLGAHCRSTGERINSLQHVFSCGAPVSAEVQRATLEFVGAGAKMHTPYGATECLPISTIESAEVLGETEAQTAKGAGVCVGRKFDSIEWRVIRISDEPIASIVSSVELPSGEIGELIVYGPQVSPEYITRRDANALAKIADGERIWHRTGDVGYFDEQERFWYCGRKAHRVTTENGSLFTECVEAIFNSHPDVARTALVGLGERGSQSPVVFFEPNAINLRTEGQIARELRGIGQGFPHTRSIKLFAEFDRLPVDVRHNAKILREELGEWAKELDLLCVEDPTSSE